MLELGNAKQMTGKDLLSMNMLDGQYLDILQNSMMKNLIDTSVPQNINANIPDLAW
jgi:hypothetical protein